MYTVSLSEAFFPAIPSDEYQEVTVGGLLGAAAKQWPDKVAYVPLDQSGAEIERWTYKALFDKSHALALILTARHKAQARVAVWAPNIMEWILMEFACGMAGLTLVTVNPSYQPRELDYVLRQSRSEALYYIEGFRGNPMGDIAREVTASIDDVVHLIDLQDHSALFGGVKAANLPDVSPSDAAQIQYTSGTTGFPKGALLHHHGIIQNARDWMGRAGVVAGDNLMLLMPLFHTSGCGMGVMGGCAVGATQFLPPLFDPAMVIDVIERENITFFMGVPSMITLGVEEVKKRGLRLDSLKGVASGGAMVAPELVRAAKTYLGCPIQIVYGQTESSPVITFAWRDDSFEDMTGTVGQPAPHMDVAILQPDGRYAAPDEIGEICTRGYHVMTGYNDNQAATKAAIDADGWLHTGDLGCMDSRGYVRVTGRLKEMIIRGGENMFPAEIENAVLEHSDVAEAAVVGLPSVIWGEEVACFMRSATGNRPSNDALKVFIRDRLSPQKTPAYWIWVEDWPMTGSGKIQKFKLQEGYAAGEYR